MYILSPYNEEEKRILINTDCEKSFYRLYHETPPHSKHWCHSHCVFGGGFYKNFFSMILFFFPTVLYCISTIPNFYRVYPLLIVPFLLLFIIVCIFYFKACYSNPGIIPRKYRIGNGNDELNNSRIDVILPDNIVASRKFCMTCLIIKPLRCSHCRICNNCVEEFDHHCPWLGNCIGRRNYKSYMGIVFFCSVYLFYLIITSFISLFIGIQYPLTWTRFFDNWKSHWFVEPLTCIYCVPCFGLVFTLLIFHIYQISRGITTNERIKKRYIYNQGFINNWIKFLFRPIPPIYPLFKNNFK
ncbi:palmitoyltransferase, putative [Entamoeba histolytica KU27]|nr:palmitoyltransferase, putative [Entamoeba histolytica KU27]